MHSPNQEGGSRQNRAPVLRKGHHHLSGQASSRETVHQDQCRDQLGQNVLPQGHLEEVGTRHRPKGRYGRDFDHACRHRR